ncbi:AfsR/SARP family transcriptional regulator [Nonomuraea jiangxiensis]|uniref:DNA-binding transcriptional activator of the SARP family n=1 Tax=Nonomuraea jiangxiensis TaxID=633440 RepID=A0A1G8PWG7_9ACTN|nr:BTAD domain-containing putative transcriptional regulator [Nonomuraea jiangxiensis]SDI96797.1 DNA-binding transcriptional activator of the SARP family [Nonomuraea jiangxiensis]
MMYGLLGPVEVRTDHGELALGGERTRCVLAVLLLNANRVVSTQQLIEATWGDHAPATARAQAQNRASSLRRLLRAAGDGDDPLVPKGSGYLMSVADGQLDLQRMDSMVTQAEVLAGSGRPEEAGVLLRQALGLWRGPALDGLDSLHLRTVADHLEERRLAILERRIELDLALDRHADVVSELEGLVIAQPFRERLRGLLMMALHGSGRHAEALDVFRRTRRQLIEQLGVEPGAELQRLHERLLRGGGAGDELSRQRRASLSEESVPAITAIKPAQLPVAPSLFVGRASHFRQLDSILPKSRDGASPYVCLIWGAPGVGKTALALHWAHKSRDHFPDGQLYTNLRGFDPAGTPVSPAEALRGFLEALHVPARHIPMDLDGRMALYRSIVVDRRILVILDNARDAEQVRPLLPGSAGCRAVVTSRRQLDGLLATHGAKPVMLDVFTEGEAVDFLTARLGAERADRDQDTVEAVAGACARLPLALAIVAGRAAAHPRFSIAEVHRELLEGRDRLDALAVDDPVSDPRAVFSWSYGALDASAARLFRLLGTAPGPDISATAAASLAGLPLRTTQSLLGELTRASLLVEHVPGRYTFHDLLRAYAGEQARVLDSESDLREARHRLLDHYVHLACAAALKLDPQREPIALDPPRAGVVLIPSPDRSEAFDWFVTEYQGLLAAVLTAGDGFEVAAWRLAWALATFCTRQGLLQDQIAMQETVLEQAARAGDLVRQALSHRLCARACTMVGDQEQAAHHYEQAIAMYDGIGDRGGAAVVRLGLARVYEFQKQYELAIEQASLSLELFRQREDGRGQAMALNAVGWNHGLLGRYEEALSHCDQALVLCQRLGDAYAEAGIRDSLGFAYHNLGRYGEAVESYEHGLRLFQQAGDRYNEADVLTHLGDTHQAAGSPSLAQAAWRAAIAILDDLRHPDADRIRGRLTG